MNAGHLRAVRALNAKRGRSLPGHVMIGGMDSTGGSGRLDEAAAASSLLFPDEDEAVRAIMAQVGKPLEMRIREVQKYWDWSPTRS